MSSELLLTKNIQKQKEEIRAKLKENWDEIAYFDVLYYRTWELINEKEEYFGLSAWDVLDNDFLNFESFLRKGRVKDWVGLFKEYQRCMKKYKGNQGPFGFQLYEEFLEYTLEGLVRSLKQGDIVQKDKLNPFLLEEIKDLLKETGFEVLNVNHSDFISFLQILVKSKRFCCWDCKLADKLPSFLVSGYYIACRKRGYATK